MQFLKDLISSLYKHLDTRINSPVMGTFSVFFIIINWDKFILLLLGSGTIESRVNQFKSFLENINIINPIIAVLLTISYLLILPGINYIIGLAQGWIEHLRYTENINQRVNSEKIRGRLINSKYKAEHQNEIAAQEIVEEIAISNEKIEQQKILTQKLKDNHKASKKIIQSMYEKSEKTKKELDTIKKDKETAEIKYQREKLAYIKMESLIQEKRKISQLTLSFYLIHELDLSLKEDLIKISFSGLIRIITSVFGYQSFEKLIEDKNFNSESLDHVDYIIYSEELIIELNNVLEDEKISDDINSQLVFEHLQIMFKNKLNIEILTAKDISNEVRDNLEGNVLYDLLNTDEVSGSIAETNAYFEDIEDLEITSYSLTDSKFDVKLECVISGETHDDKSFCGDQIDISFINRRKIILGKFAIGLAENVEIASSVRHDYYDEYYDIDEDSSKKQ